MVECNLARNNHITYDVRPPDFWVIIYVVLRQKSLVTLVEVE